MRTRAYLEKMRRDWDARALENPWHYIANGKPDWTQDEFYSSGLQTAFQDIHADLDCICQGREPGEMRVLEIGCGAGRVTRALAQVFGEVHAVDVSAEMIRLARHALRDTPNAFVYQNNGKDLSCLPKVPFQFAYSTAVFHHIASREVIHSYVKEVGRVLEPGSLFKFEVQGFTGMKTTPEETWLGIPFSAGDVAQLARSTGFECRRQAGEGEERYWLWFFKK